MSAPVIEARGLTKTYRAYGRPLDRLLELLLRRPRHREFHALSNVSFEVRAGESLGIIGENGAGKSTLLKILAGVLTPTAGSLTLNGKVASILELGSGFHPELTGRSNIFLNAAMHGLSEAETRDRLEAVVDFSELGEFIDQPVKCYSTGMAMRLGFAIATQVEPEVLIIDEALAVGDGYFQKKCMDRLMELVDEGRTILFCSHAMYYVTAFCQRALWLSHGEVAAWGSADDVVRQYENALQAKSAHHSSAHHAVHEPVPAAGAPARITSVQLPAGRTYRHRGTLAVEVEWESQDDGRRFHVGIGVNRIDEVEVLAFGTHLDGMAAVSGHRCYRSRLAIEQLPMLKGTYTLYVFLLDEQGLHIYDRRILPGAFEVLPDGFRLGLVEAEHGWQVEPLPAPSEVLAANSVA